MKKIIFLTIVCICVGLIMALNGKKISFILSSNSFKNKELIPAKFTCDGANISPELHWSGAPERTKSFALIVDDPDAPTQEPFVHWVLFNIPGNSTNLPENLDSSKFKHGITNFDTDKYGGPCPPSGTHGYHFKLYALDIEKLDLSKSATKQDLLKAIKGHILGQAELIGDYKRTKA